MTASPRQELLRRFGPWFVFVVALAIRMAYVLESRHSPLFDVFLVDADYYDQLARRILGGDWLAGNRAFTMSPLYPYFLAVLYKITGIQIFWVKIAQHAIGAASCALLCSIGIRLIGPAGGILAGLAASTYGLFIFAESTLENEFLVIFFNLLAMRILLSIENRPALPAAAAAGLAIGLSTGIRPNGGLLVVPALIWIFSVLPDRRRAAKLAVALVFAAAIPVFGIALRNYKVTGEWIWTTSTGGQLVYIGTIPGGAGGYVLPDFVRPEAGSEHEDFENEVSRAMGRPVKSGEVSGYWIRQAWRTIYADPYAYVKLLGKKTLAFCSSNETPDNYDYAFDRQYSRILSAPLPAFSLIFPLAAVGVCFAARPVRNWILPIGFLGVYALCILAFYQSYRFRLPAVPCLILLAAAAVIWGLEKTRARSGGILAAACVIGAGAYLLTLNPYPPRRGEFARSISINNYYRLIERKGRFEEARAFLRESIKKDPDYTQNIAQLAGIFMTRGQFGKAAEYFDQVIRDTAVPPSAARDMAVCLLELKKPELAMRALAECLRRTPDDPDATYLAGYALRMMGRTADAKIAFERVIRLDPNHPAAPKALRALGSER